MGISDRDENISEQKTHYSLYCSTVLEALF